MSEQTTRPRRRSGPLNQRQVAILELVSAGWTHAETAEELGISRTSVSDNMSVVVTKLGAVNSAQAMYLWGRSLGFLDAARHLRARRRADGTVSRDAADALLASWNEDGSRFLSEDRP